jgi:TATA-box binding protein (TBP) (component of TFIID and TFIIIB)
VDEHVIMQIVNPSGRIQFKDVRKVSIGLCKKDIISHRCKKKSAFYNCFVVILRVKDDNNDSVFREIHAKVFNTGKMEIPGIQTKEMLDKVLVLITDVLRPIVLKSEACKSEACKSEACESEACKSELGFIEEKSETVLINSNFRCGYYINREKLYSLLKYKYKISSAYDPCSYPGIQCEFYYDPLIDTQTGKQPNDMKDRTDITKVSFMIFRTGSVLIVGKCNEDILQKIYLFIRSMLETEYKDIHINQQLQDIQTEKVKNTQEHNKKIKKKTIVVYTQSSQLI